MEMKTCNCCWTELPATKEYFQTRKSNKDGFMGKCRKCMAKYKKQYQEAHKAEKAAYDKEYKKAHKETDTERHRQYYKAHKAERAEQAKQWYRENKDNSAQKSKAYYAQHKESVIRCVKQYRNTHKDTIAIRQAQYRKTHKKAIAVLINQWKRANPNKMRIIRQRRKAKRCELPATLTEAQWTETKDYFNNTCAYCGRKLKLEQDHFIPLSNNGPYTQENIIPACRTCNSSKQDKDFFIWYETYKYFSEERADAIVNYISYMNER